MSFLKPLKGKFNKLYFLDNPEQNNFIPKERLKSVADKLKIRSEVKYSALETLKSNKSKTSGCVLEFILDWIPIE